MREESCFPVHVVDIVSLRPSFSDRDATACACDAVDLVILHSVHEHEDACMETLDVEIKKRHMLVKI